MARGLTGELQFKIDRGLIGPAIGINADVRMRTAVVGE